MLQYVTNSMAEGMQESYACSENKGETMPSDFIYNSYCKDRQKVKLAKLNILYITETQMSDIGRNFPHIYLTHHPM